jgi:hypothetical protein
MQPADVAASNRARKPHHHTSAAIEHIHHAIAHEPHPQHKATLTSALSLLTKMQAQMMGPASDARGNGS